MGKAIVATLTSKVLRGWLWLEKTALEKRGHREQDWWQQQQPLCSSGADNVGVVGVGCQQDYGTTTHDNVNIEVIVAQGEDPGSDSSTGDSFVCPLSIEEEKSSRHGYYQRHQLQLQGHHRLVPRFLQQAALLIVCAALIAYYAFVHVHIIQRENHVFYTCWFYEWFMIPILLSFVFAAPLHRALGCPCHKTDVDVNVDVESNFDGGSDRQQEQDEDRWRQRLALAEEDPTTQRLVVAVAVCYVAYIIGDASFFIPLSPNCSQLTTYVIYLLAVLTNMAFIYQGFLLSILAMRVMLLRLRQLEAQISTTLQHESKTTTTTTQITHEQIMHWVHAYQEIQQDMHSLSTHFGKRMVIGISMFIVEVTNLILNVWEAIGSHLTNFQTLWLLLTYTANAAILIMVTTQTASMTARCTEYIGPQLAWLSLRSNHSKFELNVLAQAIQHTPIRLRAGTFHVTAEYANAIMAWFFGLFLVVFGMKLPDI